MYMEMPEPQLWNKENIHVGDKFRYAWKFIRDSVRQSLYDENILTLAYEIDGEYWIEVVRTPTEIADKYKMNEYYDEEPYVAEVQNDY